jgi:hypothetical protein
MAGTMVGTIVLAAGCDRPPDRVFVPGRPFTHVVEVRTSQGGAAEVRAGEWLTLHARRSTGPWVEVARTSLGPEGCWVAPPPPAVEEEVADNVTWTAPPASGGRFNLEIFPDHTRRVRFAAPGRYTLRASSTTWCSPAVDSNELTVVVRE